jgi:hypothetical protein
LSNWFLPCKDRLVHSVFAFTRSWNLSWYNHHPFGYLPCSHGVAIIMVVVRVGIWLWHLCHGWHHRGAQKWRDKNYKLAGGVVISSHVTTNYKGFSLIKTNLFFHSPKRVSKYSNQRQDSESAKILIMQVKQPALVSHELALLHHPQE